MFSGTHPHGIYITIILYSETRSRSVFLSSFITDLWTPRNVALVILIPQSKKLFPRAWVLLTLVDNSRTWKNAWLTPYLLAVAEFLINTIKYRTT